MSALRDHLHTQITASGPITLAEYMATCLMHPQHGYYARRDPLGAGGDFTTAPEISQMFGELIGLSLAQCWLDQGSPAPFALVEPGPGRGTLMADIWRATAAVPGFHKAAQIHLVEVSETLRDIQKENLTGLAPHWHGTVETLPDLPLFCVANEFFDALPIRQFQRSGKGWRERVIGLSDAKLAFGLSDEIYPPLLSHRLEDTKDGDLIEHCPAGAAIAAALGERIKRHGGTALIIDYGDWRSLGDTFQALQNHQTTGPLAAPGEADLTAHVDFEALAHAAPCAHSRLTAQGVFLERLGIARRAQALAKNLHGAALENHIAAFRRLTHPEEMGNLFKVIALYPQGGSPPPGLEP